MASPDFQKSPGLAEIAELEQIFIRHLAYRMYELCGCEDGHDLDDWLFAEKQIKGLATGESPRRTAA